MEDLRSIADRERERVQPVTRRERLLLQTMGLLLLVLGVTVWSCVNTRTLKNDWKDLAQGLMRDCSDTIARAR